MKKINIVAFTVMALAFTCIGSPSDVAKNKKGNDVPGMEVSVDNNTVSNAIELTVVASFNYGGYDVSVEKKNSVASLPGLEILPAECASQILYDKDNPAPPGYLFHGSDEYGYIDLTEPGFNKPYIFYSMAFSC